MQAKAVSAALIGAMLFFAPLAPAGSAQGKDSKAGKDAKASKRADERSTSRPASANSGAKDRSSSWHGKNWKPGRSANPVTRTSPSPTVRVSAYQPPQTGAATTRPADQHVFRTPPDAKYDYFADRYGRRTGGSSGELFGHVPPRDTSNAANPFIYRRK